MEKQRGFTIIELIVAIVIITVVAVIFVMQKQDLDVSARDTQRRTAINAMYYSLEEVYYKDKKFYPLEITEKTLPSVDPALLKDSKGRMIGDQASDYRYEPNGCNGKKCSGYTLRANLENEEDYIKQNR